MHAMHVHARHLPLTVPLPRCTHAAVAGCQGVLPLDEVRRRVAQFTSAGAPVVVTRAPLFTHKAALFRDTLFVVGYDTAIRLVLPKYYGPPPGNPNKPSPANITAMLLEFDRRV